MIVTEVVKHIIDPCVKMWAVENLITADSPQNVLCCAACGLFSMVYTQEREINLCSVPAYGVLSVCYYLKVLCLNPFFHG